MQAGLQQIADDCSWVVSGEVLTTCVRVVWVGVCVGWVGWASCWEICFLIQAQ
jgi:hypothetical protein